MTRHTVVPVYLVCCLMLGGASASGFTANLILQLLALPLIGWAMWDLIIRRTKPTWSVGAVLGLFTALVFLMLLQLVPLPPSIWTRLPGRAVVAANYGLLDIPLPWLPFTLAPQGAVANLLWLLPATATLLAVTVSGSFRGSWTAVAILAMTLTGIALGTVQVASGGATYFYEITNYGVAVGFFANANHNATLMLVCIPFLAALGQSSLRSNGSPRTDAAIRLLLGSAYAVILVGLLINKSLAGIGLCVPVATSSWLIFSRMRPALRSGVAVLGILLSAGALIAVATDPSDNLFGKQRANVELSRQTSFALTWHAAREYLPFGSGVGSFQSIYHTQEPLADVTSTYMNHAHNDWLELLLETGVPGMVLAVAFLAWWMLRVNTIWRMEEADPFAQAAVVASAAIMLHSFVDYPLRTAALSAVFAACIGLIAGARPHVPRQPGPLARHLTL